MNNTQAAPIKALHPGEGKKKEKKVTKQNGELTLKLWLNVSL